MKCNCNEKVLFHSRYIRTIKDIANGEPCNKQITVAKFKCTKCNHIYTHPEMDRTPVTEAFKKMVISRCLKDTYTSVARYAGISDVSVRNIFSREIDSLYHIENCMPVIININVMENILIISSGIDQSIIDVTDNLDIWLQDKDFKDTQYILLSSLHECLLSVFVKIITCLNKVFNGCCFINKTNLHFGYQQLFIQHIKKMNIKSNVFKIEDFFNATDYWMDLWPDDLRYLRKQWDHLVNGEIMRPISIIIDSVYKIISGFYKEYKWMEMNWQKMIIQRKEVENIHPFSSLHLKYYLFSCIDNY